MQGKGGKVMSIYKSEAGRRKSLELYDRQLACCGTEVKMEVRCPVELAESAVNTVKKIHPYEEPVINVIPLLEL